MESKKDGTWEFENLSLESAGKGYNWIQCITHSGLQEREMASWECERQIGRLNNHVGLHTHFTAQGRPFPLPSWILFASSDRSDQVYDFLILKPLIPIKVSMLELGNSGKVCLWENTVIIALEKSELIAKLHYSITQATPGKWQSRPVRGSCLVILRYTDHES